MKLSALGQVHYLKQGPQGNNGSPAVSYWIVTSQSSIKRNANGIMTPPTVSAVRMKSVGISMPQATNEYVLVYCEYASNGALIKRQSVNNGQSITPSSNAVSLNFYMLPSLASDLTLAIASASISVVADGDDGVGSYALDLDNENVSIGLTARNGSLYPATGYNVGMSGIYVGAGGSNTATITKVELRSAADAVIATATSSGNGSWSSTELGITSLALTLNKITVTFDTNKAHTSGERLELKLNATMSVTDGGGTRSVNAYKVWTIMFQPPGADGVSPTVYELQPAHASIVIDPNNNNARTPATTSCKVIKHVGNAFSDVTNSLSSEGLKLFAVVDNVENETASQNVGSASNLEWRLKKGSNVIDKETIAFVKGGVDGVSPVSLIINPSAIVFNENSLSAKSVTVQINRGGEIENPASVTCATTIAKLSVSVSDQPGGSKVVTLSPQAGFSYNGDLILAVTDSNGDIYNGSISIGTIPKVSNGNDAITPYVSPGYINYTSGEQKTIAMTLNLMEGSTLRTPTSIEVRFNGTALNSSGGISWNSSSKSLTIASNATFGTNSSDTIGFTLTYSGKTYNVSVPVSRTLNGSRGPAGLIYRKTEWHNNTEYSNDTALLGQQDFCYLDITYKLGSDGKVSGVWECLQSHTSSAESEPFGDGNAYWRKVNLMKPIYTPLLLAEGSVISFMQGNQLKIYDLNGNLKAGVSAATGDYPIFYANPQNYPTRVDVSYSVTTSTITNNNTTWKDNSAITSSNRLTLPNNNYLHLRFGCYWSNGTYTEVFRSNVQNTTGAQLQVSSPMAISFCSTRTNSSSEANASTPSSVPNTSVARPYLWVGAQLSTRFFGWYQIALQASGVEDSTKAMFQVKESGDVMMGMPTGSRIEMRAAPTDGLPRMDIYNEAGNLSAIYDGSEVGDSSELYGSGTASASLIGSLSVYTDSAPNDYAETDFVNVSTEKRTTISVEKDSSLNISAFTLNVSANFYNGANNSDEQYVVAALYVDSQMVSQGLLRKTEGTTMAFTFPQREISISKGLHNIVLRLTYVGQYGDGSLGASCNINNASTPIAFTASYGRLMCRYFSNGLAIGSATNNYFMAWNDNDGYMNFVMENKGTYGLKVTRDGVFIKRPTNLSNDKWVAL